MSGVLPPGVTLAPLASGTMVVLHHREDISARPAALPDDASREAVAAALHRRVATTERGPGAWLEACFPALTGVAVSSWAELHVPRWAAASCSEERSWTALVRRVAPRATRAVVREAAVRFGPQLRPASWAVLSVIALVDALVGSDPSLAVSAVGDRDVSLRLVARLGLTPRDGRRVVGAISSELNIRVRRRLLRQLLLQPTRWSVCAAMLSELDAPAQARIAAHDPRDLDAFQLAIDRVWTQAHRQEALAAPPLPDLVIDGWRLIAPATPGEIIAWGSQLANCLDHRDARRVQQGRSVLLGLRQDGCPNPEVVLEVVDGRVTQLLSARNQLPEVPAVVASYRLLERSRLLSPLARERLFGQLGWQALLDVARAATARSPSARRRTSALLWSLGWLPHDHAPPEGALDTLRARGPVTPPLPLPPLAAVGQVDAELGPHWGGGLPVLRSAGPPVDVRQITLFS